MSGNGQVEKTGTITCPKCKEQMQVVEPDVQVVNMPKSSIIISVHENPQACKCGNLVQAVIRGIQVQWAWREVDVQTQSGIVAPPAGFRIT